LVGERLVEQVGKMRKNAACYSMGISLSLK